MKVGVIGSGSVGETLANGFIAKGHSVMRGSRDPQKLSEWAAGAGANASAGTFAETAAFGEVIVLAVKGTAAGDAVRLAGIENLAGKLVLDATNPIADAAPVNGVLQYCTEMNHSLMERLQDLAPAAKFVKCFSCVGAHFMVDPQLPGGPPTMFICGNDADSKARTQEILQSFGWEWADMGSAEAARAIEPLAMLWCIPGFLQNQWTHAFKLLKA